jgi:hypothetical protein
MLSYSCLKFRKSYTPPAAQIRVNSSDYYDPLIQPADSLSYSNNLVTHPADPLSCSKDLIPFLLIHSYIVMILSVILLIRSLFF